MKKFWQRLKRLLDPAHSVVDETFSMGSRGPSYIEERQAEILSHTQVRTKSLLRQIDSLMEATPKGKEALDQVGDLSPNLDENKRQLERLFRLPANKDFIMREFTVATQPPTQALICFLEGLTDKNVVNGHILKSLMLLSHLDHHLQADGEEGPTQFSIETVIKRLLPGNQVTEQYDFKSVTDAVLSGDSVLLFEGERVGISVETKNPPSRSVAPPLNEKVVQGSHDGFVEPFRINVALVRRRLKDPRVVTEVLSVGTISNSYVAIMYIDGLTAPKLIKEVRRRVESIKVDILNGAGILEAYLEDAPKSLFPGTLTTERPDRTAAYLSEGNVAIIVDNSPFAVICPVTFWSLFQTSEDYYLRYPFPTFLRFIRFLAFLLAMLMPAFFVAIINYHHDMIPTGLILFIASTREHVPLPAFLEIVVMDFSFDLIREAGTRIPSVIGGTIGLVASLVLGQAAVEARLVSPLTVVIVALTGLASFALPSYLASWGTRFLRFIFLGAAGFLGFYGMAAAGFILVMYLASMRSFGVPYLAPIGPQGGMMGDILVRQPLYQMEERPPYTEPLDDTRQSKIVREWDPYTGDHSLDPSDSQDGGSSDAG
jgi:spore germination protein KA